MILETSVSLGASWSVFISWTYFVCFYEKSVKGAKPSRTAEKNSAYLGMVGLREFKIVFMPQNKISFI